MKSHSLFILILLLLAMRNTYAQQLQGCATNPPDFVKLPYQEIDNMLYDEEQKKICSEYIENLVRQLHDSKLNDDNKTLAIYFLGELRPTDTDSIEILINNIDFRATKIDPKTRFPRWGAYPAEEALVKIGQPVVIPILNHLPSETNQLRRQLMCEVLWKVMNVKTFQAEYVAETSNCVTNPPDFIHLSYEKANEAVNLEDNLIGRGVEKICPEYITNLVYQLQHGHLTNDNKTLAIYFLGTFRPSDTNSIETLIEDIDFRSSKVEVNLGPARWGMYPAKEALIKIGKPVVNPILEHLITENNELRRHLMCEVLKRVEGQETAQSQIKQRLVGESDSIKQANLEAALKELTWD